ncbi:DUF3857 domain-containing protein [Labilibacter marinus]|uniref:DUF3857 domain-containing protein n=1 Tax=Labilibacter marinus TaxID=1477105 RepID=UPI000832E37A|nr:DUF3857 domain-containing protein [Labilibacter marinus]
MLKLRSIALIACISLITTNALAAKAYMKYGKISQEEIDMTVCPNDSNASAVVLADMGHTFFEITAEDIFMKFEKHIRIKVFDKEAFDKGNFKIFLYKSYSGGEEKVNSIKGAVYNMKDGKLEKTKLSSKQIIRDELDKSHNIVKITMPDVKEGSIIELSYLVQSPFIFNLRNWYFQSDIPTIHSEYLADVIEWYDYKNWMEGYVHINKTERTTHEKFSFRTSATIDQNGRTAGQTHELEAKVTHMKYIADSVPAFKNEPLITTPQDYLSSIQFELRSTKYPWSTYKSYTKDWSSINKTLLDDDNFGLTLKNDGHLKDIATSISSKSISDEQKACMAYQHINHHMLWNKSHSLDANKTIRKAYMDEKGNSGDINLNLVALCKKIGLDAYPVITSTRNHGMIRPGLVSLTQFNHVIVAVNIDGKYLLMDATESNCPYNLLPAKCLNGRGRLVRNGMGDWVDLYSNIPNKEMYMANLIMDEEFNLNGNITYKAENYAAVKFRRNYKSKENEEEFIDILEKRYKDAELTEFEIQDLDSITKPVVLKSKIKLTNRINQAGDMVFLNPKLFSRAIENIFKREERTYPVDYNFPIKKQFIIRITIPEGYEIDELPEKLVMALPNNSAKYIFVTATQGRTIQLTNQYMINQTIFPGNEYPDLRKFNEMIVTKEAEQVVLKKI